MKFETNKKYSCRSACDSNCTWLFTVIKRTAKFVTLEDQDGEIIRKGIIVIDGVEKCMPLGKYSMAPVISAESKVEGEAVEEIKEVKSVDITEAVETAENAEYIELQTEEATETTEPTEADEPHYVIQHRKETKKIGIFPSYESALTWVDENSEKHKGMLGIYRVSTYDQEIKAKFFELVDESFKEVKPFYEGQTITETEIEGCKATVKYQGGNRNIHGGYKGTDTDSKKKNADILIKYANGGSFTVTVKPHVIIKGRGVKDRYDSTSYEVSSNKLKQLQKSYSSMCDF